MPTIVPHETVLLVPPVKAGSDKITGVAGKTSKALLWELLLPAARMIRPTTGVLTVTLPVQTPAVKAPVEAGLATT